MLTCDESVWTIAWSWRFVKKWLVLEANKAQNIAGYSWTLLVFFQRFVCSTFTSENYPSLLLLSDGLKASTRRFPARNPRHLKNGYLKEAIWYRSYAFVHPFSKIHHFQFTCQVSSSVPSLKITNRTENHWLGGCISFGDDLFSGSTVEVQKSCTAPCI